MKKIKKNYKLIIIALIILIIAILGIFICKNLFQLNDNGRLEGIENHKLTEKEIGLVKEKFNELEDIVDIDISTNYKIIKIFLEFNDTDFEDIKKISDESVEKFSKDNLEFYDIEIFVELLDSEGNKYSKIGYKHKSSSEFTWNR
jgi:hypothetical protein